MHPNDILFVLAFALLNPLASAAPIFPNSNDIDENGYFIPEVNQRDLKDDLNHAIDDANSALTSIAGNVDQSYNPPDIPHLPKRDLIGTLEGFVNNGINTVEHGVNGILGGILKARDLKGDLNSAIDDANSALDSIAGNVDQSYNPPDIPHLPKRDLHLTLDEIRKMQAANTQQIKRDLDQRDLIGTLEGVVNTGISTVEHGVNGILGGILGKRDGDDGLHLTLAEIQRMQAAGNQQTKRGLEQRDLVGDVNGIIDTANRDFGRIAGDVDPNIDLPDIPHIPSKRDEPHDMAALEKIWASGYQPAVGGTLNGLFQEDSA